MPLARSSGKGSGRRSRAEGPASGGREGDSGLGHLPCGHQRLFPQPSAGEGGERADPAQVPRQPPRPHRPSPSVSGCGTSIGPTVSPAITLGPGKVI